MHDAFSRVRPMLARFSCSTEPFEHMPTVLAGTQTVKGGDMATVKWRSKDLREVGVRIAEEQSHDNELRYIEKQSISLRSFPRPTEAGMHCYV
jgi:hypothetical protein